MHLEILWQPFFCSVAEHQHNPLNILFTHMEKLDSSGRLPSLDGLRAISILLVLIGHGSATLRFHPGAATILGYIGAGRLGVSTFFVISGFLITTLLAHEQRSTETINLKNFYIRRAFRIFPAFYVYWLVALSLTLLGFIHLPRIELISSAIYVWNYVPRKIDNWFLGHTWSLSVEEQFYLLWPLILKVSGPKRGKWMALLVIVLAPFLRVASYFLFPPVRPLIGMMLPTRADSLMIGSLLALLAQDKAQMELLARAVRSWWIPAATVCFVAIDTVLCERFRGAYLLPFGFSAQNLVLVVLVAHVVFYDKTRLGRVLNNSVVVHVGAISYSLYLWQQLFLTSKNTTFTGIFPLNIVCAFIAAELSYKFIEKPFLSWRKRFSVSGAHAEAAKDYLACQTTGKQLAASAST
jgi:peptidoglycan/LPS O-acetylase OafA/YrhL